jgi:hypothetical protein
MAVAQPRREQVIHDAETLVIDAVEEATEQLEGEDRIVQEVGDTFVTQFKNDFTAYVDEIRALSNAIEKSLPEDVDPDANTILIPREEMEEVEALFAVASDLDLPDAVIHRYKEILLAAKSARKQEKSVAEARKMLADEFEAFVVEIVECGEYVVEQILGEVGDASALNDEVKEAEHALETLGDGLETAYKEDPRLLLWIMLGLVSVVSVAEFVRTVPWGKLPAAAAVPFGGFLLAGFSSSLTVMAAAISSALNN